MTVKDGRFPHSGSVVHVPYGWFNQPGGMLCDADLSTSSLVVAYGPVGMSSTMCGGCYSRLINDRDRLVELVAVVERFGQGSLWEGLN